MAELVACVERGKLMLVPDPIKALVEKWRLVELSLRNLNLSEHAEVVAGFREQLEAAIREAEATPKE